MKGTNYGNLPLIESLNIGFTKRKKSHRQSKIIKSSRNKYNESEKTKQLLNYITKIRNMLIKEKPKEFKHLKTKPKIKKELCDTERLQRLPSISLLLQNNILPKHQK